MQGFRTGKTEILVATDVAARGIDVDEVEAVFNYDLPQDDEYYVHRIGRTGRAGREGRAFSFVSGKEVYKLKEIQRYCKTKIYAQKVPSLNDVANTKMENILDDVERVIEQEDLDMMINAIEERVNNSEFTAMDMAAAFLKICCGMTEDNKIQRKMTGNLEIPVQVRTEWYVCSSILVRSREYVREIFLVRSRGKRNGWKADRND